MTPETATSIPMGVWPDPQGNPLLVYSEHKTLVYLGCWEASAEPADYVCKLSFEHGWACRTMGIEFLPYETRHVGTSHLYEVRDSSYLSEVTQLRLRYYPEWKNWDTRPYHHYMISGHDNYVEVIAEGFIEERVPYGDVKQFLPLLYREDVYGLNNEA